jgi:hypothetical protein
MGYTPLQSRWQIEHDKPGIPKDITLTGEVVWALAKLRHLQDRAKVHIIVFATDGTWRVCCTGEIADNERFDLRPEPPSNCEKCDKSFNWDGGWRGLWAY